MSCKNIFLKCECPQTIRFRKIHGIGLGLIMMTKKFISSCETEKRTKVLNLVRSNWDEDTSSKFLHLWMHNKNATV